MAPRWRVMLQLQHVQRALGWCLVGVLLTYVLINAIGFVSPFWGLWRRPGDPGASSSLLHAWQQITPRSEEHTSELQSLMRISYAVFCLKKKKQYARQSEYTHSTVQ